MSCFFVSICRLCRLDIFALWQIRYNRRWRFRYDINPRSRSEHIECEAHIERASVYQKSAQADLYRWRTCSWSRCANKLFRHCRGVIVLQNLNCLFVGLEVENATLAALGIFPKGNPKVFGACFGCGKNGVFGTPSVNL